MLIIKYSTVMQGKRKLCESHNRYFVVVVVCWRVSSLNSLFDNWDYNIVFFTIDFENEWIGVRVFRVISSNLPWRTAVLSLSIFPHQHFSIGCCDFFCFSRKGKYLEFLKQQHCIWLIAEETKVEWYFGAKRPLSISM